jgi:tetratricopeptide (TPR) repeat protein
MGRTEDALEAAAQALRLKSGDADEYFLAGVGAAYAVAGRYEEARAPLQRFLSRYPNFLPAHLMLAVVYSELGQAAEARASEPRTFRFSPTESSRRRPSAAASAFVGSIARRWR